MRLPKIMKNTTRRIGQYGFAGRLLQRFYLWLWEPSRRYVMSGVLNPYEQDLLNQIARDGYVVIPGYFNPEECRQAITEIEAAVGRYPTAIQIGQGSDRRLFGVQHVSPIAKRFATDPLWLRLADHYTGRRNVLFSTLANIVEANLSNSEGSGGGWHRDGFARELKSLVYLSDVTNDNGPFHLIARSNRTRQIVRDMLDGGLAFLQNRIRNDQVQKILNRDKDRYVRLPAPAGTVLVFDTSILHTGSPIRCGSRYALTNYIIDSTLVNKDLYESYSPYIASIEDAETRWKTEAAASL